MSEFSMFYNLFGCMYACILHVLSVCLTRDATQGSNDVTHKNFNESLTEIRAHGMMKMKKKSDKPLQNEKAD